MQALSYRNSAFPAKPEFECHSSAVAADAMFLSSITANDIYCGALPAFAAVQTLMANGGVSGGKRLLSEAGVRRAQELQIEGHDLILNMPVRYGLGYGLPGPARPFPNPNSVFWGGYGGSLVVCDMDARLCMSYLLNKMAGTTVGDMRAGMLMAGVWGALMG